MSNSKIQVNNCPTGMNEAYAIHCLNKINDWHKHLKVKKTIWNYLEQFASGLNAQFYGELYADSHILLPLYQEFLNEHPDRQMYRTPTHTINFSEFCRMLDRAKGNMKVIGKIRLFDEFRFQGYLVKNRYNMPSEEMVRNGWMISTPSHRCITTETPLLTPAGFDHFAKKVVNDFYFLGQEQL